MKRICGIYSIQNVATHMRYIGASINIKKRWNKHENYLKLNKHWNFLLQNEYNLYGKDLFEYTIIQYLPLDKDVLKFMETYWIVYYDAFVECGKGYNLTYGSPNFHPSEISKERNRKAQEGKILSEDHKKKISDFMSSENNPNRGKVPSEDTRKKMSESGKTKIFTEEHKRHLSESHSGEKSAWFNKHLPEETREKIAEAQRGEKSPRFNWEYTDEEIDLISKGRQGIKNAGSPSSIYVGVSFTSFNAKWKAVITHKKKSYHLGFFDIEEDAARAYDDKAREIYGDNAKTNFPKDISL